MRHLRRGSDERGFTLIELLIVMVVIGILSGIVTFAVGGFRAEATSAAAAGEIRIVRTALEAFRARNPEAPDPTVDELVAGDYLRSAPSYVDIVDGEVVALDPSSTTTSTSTSTSSTSSTTTSSTTSTTLAPAAAIASLTGATTALGGSNYQVIVTVTVSNGLVPVNGASIAGSWTDSKPGNSCTTNSLGVCTFTSTHGAAATWTLSTFSAPGHTTGSHSKSALSCSKPAVAGTCS